MWSIPGARRVTQLLSLPFSPQHQNDRNLDSDELSSSSSDEEEFAEDDGNPDLPWYERKTPACIQQKATMCSVDENKDESTQSTALETEENRQQATPQTLTQNNPTLEEAGLVMSKEYKTQALQPEQDIEAPQEMIIDNNPTPEESEVALPANYKLQSCQPAHYIEAPQLTVTENNPTPKEPAIPEEHKSQASQPEQDIESPQEANARSTLVVSSQLKSQEPSVGDSIADKESDQAMNTSEPQNDIIMCKSKPVQPTEAQNCEAADIVALSHWLSKWDHSASGSSSFNEKYTENTEHKA